MSTRKLFRGAKIGLFTLIDYVTAERWLCECECGTRELRSVDALQDNRSVVRCAKCRSKRMPTRRSKSAKAEVRSRAERIRSRLDHAARPGRLQRMLRGRRLDTRSIMAEFGIHCDKTELAIVAEWLRRNGCRKVVTVGRNAWEWAGVEGREEPVAPAGPCLENSDGEKRECARYEGCLTAFLKAYPSSTTSRCPSACAYFVPMERSRLLRKACEDVSYSLSGANFGGA